MISFDGNGVPFELMALMVVLSLVGCCGTGLFTELTWRNNALKDLEIAERLRSGGSPELASIAEECEERAAKRVSDHCNGRNKVSVLIGVLLRGIPYFALMMAAWPVYQLYCLYAGTFSIMDALVSLVYWFIAALATEGFAVVAGYFVKPLSKRWERPSVYAASGGDEDAPEKAETENM